MQCEPHQTTDITLCLIWSVVWKILHLNESKINGSFIVQKFEIISISRDVSIVNEIV